MGSYLVPVTTSLKAVIVLHLEYNSHHVLHQSCLGPEFPGSCCTLLLLPAVDRFSCWAPQWCCAALWSAPHSAASFAPAHLRALSSGGIAHTEAEKQGNRKGVMDNSRETRHKAQVHSTIIFLLTKPTCLSKRKGQMQNTDRYTKVDSYNIWETDRLRCVLFFFFFLVFLKSRSCCCCLTKTHHLQLKIAINI